MTAAERKRIATLVRSMESELAEMARFVDAWPTTDETYGLLLDLHKARVSAKDLKRRLAKKK